jgi:hypothetical protein
MSKVERASFLSGMDSTVGYLQGPLFYPSSLVTSFRMLVYVVLSLRTTLISKCSFTPCTTEQTKRPNSIP